MKLAVVPGVKGPVMLSQVATLEVAGGPAVIDRYDRSRNINFEIELSGMPLGDVAAAVQQLPAIQNLPPGVKVVEVGDAEIVEGVQDGVQEGPQRCRHQVGVEASVDERVAIVEMVSAQIRVDVLTQYQ